MVMKIVLKCIYIGLALSSLGCDNQGHKRTYKLTHSKDIEVGMSENDVLRIMGKPDTIIKYPHHFYYSYNLNNDSYGDGQIFFDSTLRVNKIFFPNR